MKTPRLNRKLTLEAPQRIADGSGGYNLSWQPLGTLWAEVTARNGRDALLAGEPVSEVSYRIVVRAAPSGDPARPLPEQRFSEPGRLYAIKAVVETETDARFLTCFATEEVAQ